MPTITTAKLTKLIIADIPKLDPVHVYAEDLGPGRGSLLVRCFDRAWYAYWGAMGANNDGVPYTVRQFVLSCDTGYITQNLVRGNRGRISSAIQQAYDELYVERIASAIKSAFQAQQPRVTKQRAERLERLRHANALIKVISEHGRKFFSNAESGAVSRIEMDARGRLFWIDNYRGARVCIEKVVGYETDWRGFSNGGTLRQLVQDMRTYIKTGDRIHIAWIASKHWGYEDDAAKATKSAAMALPIIVS